VAITFASELFIDSSAVCAAVDQYFELLCHCLSASETVTVITELTFGIPLNIVKPTSSGVTFCAW